MTTPDENKCMKHDYQLRLLMWNASQPGNQNSVFFGLALLISYSWARNSRK